MYRFLERVLWIGSSGLVIGSVVGLVLVHGGKGDVASLVCDENGLCLPPDSVVLAIIVGVLAPIAFAVGLFGLLCSLLVRMVALEILAQRTAPADVANLSHPPKKAGNYSVDQFMPPTASR